MPEKKHIDAIAKLEFLKNKINKSESSFLITDDIIEYCYPMRDMIIQFTPLISKQLNSYWNVYIDIMNEINQKGVYVHLESVNENEIKQMGILSKLHSKTMKQFLADTSNPSHLFALFYFHVLRVDTFENSIKEPLKKILAKNELDYLCDTENMFSIKYKVKRKNNKKYITDIRAVRNCLAHFKFQIVDDQDNWKIHFKMGENSSDSAYYDESFSKEQLVEFLNNSNILYQSQYMLVSLLSAITYFKPFAKESLRVHTRVVT